MNSNNVAIEVTVGEEHAGIRVNGFVRFLGKGGSTSGSSGDSSGSFSQSKFIASLTSKKVAKAAIKAHMVLVDGTPVEETRRLVAGLRCYLSTTLVNNLT